MSKRIQALLASSECEVEVGDTIMLTFKNRSVTGHIAENGLIHRSALLKDEGEDTVLAGRVFNSLSNWADACLQEVLQEYSTRYPAWKRIKHAKSNKTFEDIWKLNAEKELELVASPTKVELTMLVERLHERVARQKEEIVRLREGKPEKPAAAAPSARILMDSPWATHVVLQRVAQTHPERLEEVRKMGLGGMKSKLKKFVSTQRVLEVPKEEVGWYTSIMDDSRKIGSDGVAKSVFDFFQRI